MSGRFTSAVISASARAVGSVATGALVSTLVGAIVPAALADSKSSDFWREREASYRESLRGPFTAVRADYVEREEALVFYAGGEGIGTERVAGAAIRIVLEEQGFLIAPVESEGATPATVGGELLREALHLGSAAYDDPDVRVGRYLLSFGLQSDLGRVLVYDPDLLAEKFRGFSVFDPDDAFRVEARVRHAEPDTVTLGTTRGLEKSFVRAAVLEFEVDGRPSRLAGFRSPGDEDGPLFVPFLDRTSGAESYGVGRYLRVDAASDQDTAIVDFNRSTNPWCAYSPFYNCVLPPEENRLPAAIRAGERAPTDH